MFEDAGAVDFGRQRERSEKKKAPLFMWEHMDETELIKHYNDIRRHLPETQLSKINLEEELLLQLHTVQALQAEIIDDEATPANQKAQVANTVAACLNKLAELQMATYTTERFKQIENLLIRHLTKLAETDETFVKAFLEDYKKLIVSLK